MSDEYAPLVFINGSELGEYKGGYTPFSFELTDHLKYGASNVLAVLSMFDSQQGQTIEVGGHGGSYAEGVGVKIGDGLWANYGLAVKAADAYKNYVENVLIPNVDIDALMKSRRSA